MADLLALLRAQYVAYQTAHWQAKGPGYYGDHLLFQRLYESVQVNVDALAEKMVGYYGVGSVNLKPSTERLATAALTLGVDDRLMALANKHDEHLYLLQQRAG